MEQIDAVSTNGNGAESAAQPSKAQTFRIQPLADRLLVRRHPDAETYDKDGLIQKAEAYRDREKRQFGTVLEVGEGLPLDNGTIRKMRVHKGDVVLFGDFAGKALDAEFGPDLIIMREDEVEAIIQADDEPDPPTNVVPFE